MALLCSLIANIASSLGGKKDSKRRTFAISDFVFKWDEYVGGKRTKPKEQSVSDMKTLLMGLAGEGVKVRHVDLHDVHRLPVSQLRKVGRKIRDHLPMSMQRKENKK